MSDTGGQRDGDEPEPGDTDTEDQRKSEMKSLTEIRPEERGAGGADARVGSPRRGELPDPVRSRLVRKKKKKDAIVQKNFARPLGNHRA